MIMPLKFYGYAPYPLFISNVAMMTLFYFSLLTDNIMNLCHCLG